MNPQDPIPMEQKTMDTAVALGEAIRTERGRYGLAAYLNGLADCMPHEWVREIARRLSQPCPPPPPPPPPFDPGIGSVPPIPPGQMQPGPVPPMPPGPPPEPRQKQPDMEKLLRLMQLMGSLK